jgi:hypothetical protein
MCTDHCVPEANTEAAGGQCEDFGAFEESTWVLQDGSEYLLSEGYA